ncbi:hypothetical protein O6H91_14G067000 [Diphasiastrum complanatum]|uniref:Uncharacterized protein n=3 Tax=Diphasiastrum complanatum TaxID=34168 RepID=A0ACC2BQL7_DIPCM|nr:hypothetical protein O6H91_14G067000 [Diphasiastrum complanatum]KAJ7531966.1 hypothetical protein O6H91_14G067000 [Diphasiastrum complanatum]KAJ7531967.1 hypothetical protein O6H91_14G067000 [Diphasiastrum complanatum]
MDGSVEVYAWGRGDLGQLGLGDDKDRDTPTKITNLVDKDIVHIAASDYHTVFLTGEGELFTTGNNDAGQLGEKSLKTQYSPVRVASLDTHTITHVACGQAHTVAVTGALVSWGTGEFGQLGHKEIAGTVDVVQPRIVRGSRELHFAHVACGAAHTLVLTGGGDVYSFGQGNNGALGHGRTSNVTVPTLVETLWGLGIVQITSGENHSAALSIDGQVFTWGRGKYGQLGHGSTDNESRPTAVKALSDQMIVQIACGGEHTMAISREGLLFTWGQGYWGQTGHGTQDDVLSPRQVLSLQKEQVMQASAGARHSIIMTRNEEIFVWGDGEQGQLGNSQSQMQLIPMSLKLGQMSGKRLLYVVAGGEHTHAVFQHTSGGELALQHERSYGNIMVEPTGELVCTEPMQVEQLANVVEENLYLSHFNQQFEKETKAAICGEGGNIHGGGLRPLRLPCLPLLIEDMTKSTRHLQVLIQKLDNIFSSVKFLTLTFKLKPDWYEKEEDTYVQARDHSGDGIDGPGLDVDMIRTTYQKVLELYNPDVVQKLGEAMIRLFEGIAKFMDKVPDSRWTRALLIGLQSPLVGEKGLGDVVSARLFSVFSLISASTTERKIVEWMRTYPKEIFGGRFVRGVQRFITNRKNVLIGRGPIPQDVASAVKVLSLLFDANQKGSVVAYNEFYNPAVSDTVDLQDEYLKWVHVREKDSQLLVSFCQVPFIFTPEAKSKVLQVEANLQKQHMVQASVVQHLFGNSFISPFLVLEVRRSSLIQDSLQQLSVHPYDLKKPLKVIFEGEAGVDEGGVTKEFFELLVHELFNVGYGMFTYNEESRNFWFNANSMETELEFQLVGIILGLAIYNNAILDVHFPLVVYKKLLGRTPQMEDFQDLEPQVLKSLQELLKFMGDVAETFGLTFQVTYDYFGEFRTHDLLPNGGDIIVTKENRQRYVDLYVKYMLEESIQVQFAAFSRGFLQVCGGPALSLFCHEELELLICGLPHFDFVALEQVTIYQGGYTKQSQIVRWFWELVKGMTIEEKKQLLFFTTGNDRAPVGGLASLKFIIQRNGDDTDRLPTAHTCFNILLIPEYSSKLKLEDRLKLAISNSTGFGLQ